MILADIVLAMEYYPVTHMTQLQPVINKYQQVVYLIKSDKCKA